MVPAKRTVRQSVSLPPELASRLKAMAKSRRLSANKVLVALVERGLEAQDHERERFMALADKLARSRDPAEQKKLKVELARLTFGD